MIKNNKTWFVILVALLVVLCIVGMVIFFNTRQERISNSTATLTVVADYPKTTWVILESISKEERISENDITPVVYNNLAPDAYKITAVNQDSSLCVYSKEFSLDPQDSKEILVIFRDNVNCLQDDY